MRLAVAVAKQLVVALVAGKRVAAILDELQHVVEIGPRKPGIGCRRAHLVEQRGDVERCRGRGQQHVLGQHVEPAGRWPLAVDLARRHAQDRRLALQHLEAVGRHQDRPARLVHPVVRPPHPLQQPRDPLRRADLDHLVHPAPVDAEVERRGRHHRPQLARRHRRLDAVALPDVQAAVMDRDRQRLLVQAPQLLEQHLALRPGIDEDDRQPRLADARQHHRGAGQPHPPGPRHAVLRQHHADLGRRTARDLYQPRRHREPDIVEQRLLVRDGRRQPDAPDRRRDRRQPRQAQRQLVAALGAGQRVDLVDDDGVEPGEVRARIRQRQQQSEALGRGQQDVGRIVALAPALVGRRVAAAGGDRDRQMQLVHGCGQVARDVGRQRLERRDVERVQPGAVRMVVQVDQARQKARQRLAATGRRNQQRALPGPRRLQHGELMRPRRPATGGEPAGKGFRQCSGHEREIAWPSRGRKARGFAPGPH